MLDLCAGVPDGADEAYAHGAYNSGIGLPVCGLSVPAAGRRPDVLGVAVQRRVRRGCDKALRVLAYGIFPPPPIVNCGLRGAVGACRRSSQVRLTGDQRVSAAKPSARPQKFWALAITSNCQEGDTRHPPVAL